MDLRLPKSLHLRRPQDFKAVYDLRCSASDAWLGVSMRPNGLGYTRVGLSVSSRYGGAVQRNRLRRLYREAFRLSRADLPQGFDLVMRPRASKEPTLAIVRTSLGELAGRLARRLGKERPCSDAP